MEAGVPPSPRAPEIRVPEAPFQPPERIRVEELREISKEAIKKKPGLGSRLLKKIALGYGKLLQKTGSMVQIVETPDGRLGVRIYPLRSPFGWLLKKVAPENLLRFLNAQFSAGLSEVAQFSGELGLDPYREITRGYSAFGMAFKGSGKGLLRVGARLEGRLNISGDFRLLSIPDNIRKLLGKKRVLPSMLGWAAYGFFDSLGRAGLAGVKRLKNASKGFRAPFKADRFLYFLFRAPVKVEKYPDKIVERWRVTKEILKLLETRGIQIPDEAKNFLENTEIVITRPRSGEGSAELVFPSRKVGGEHSSNIWKIRFEASIKASTPIPMDPHQLSRLLFYSTTFLRRLQSRRNR